jgi:hypothetical protein
MDVTLRGWSRDMGTKCLAAADLSDIAPVRDPREWVQWDGISVFKGFGSIGIHWRQKMSYTGNYRMEINLTSTDIVHLFKAWNGRELGVDLIDTHGFTVSPELRKRLLGEIKLADLTLGDLAGIAAKKEEPQAAEVKPFPRRI